MEKLETHSNQVFTKIINPPKKIETHLTVHLPVTYNKVNKYIFSLYEYNRNSILTCLTKTRMDKEFIRVFQDLHKNLTTRVLNSEYIKLDNWKSPKYQYLLKENNIDYQQAPPGIQQCNTADEFISTLKDTFITRLCSIYLDLPMQN